MKSIWNYERPFQLPSFHSFRFSLIQSYFMIDFQMEHKKWRHWIVHSFLILILYLMIHFEYTLIVNCFSLAELKKYTHQSDSLRNTFYYREHRAATGICIKSNRIIRQWTNDLVEREWEKKRQKKKYFYWREEEEATKAIECYWSNAILLLFERTK